MNFPPTSQYLLVWISVNLACIAATLFLLNRKKNRDESYRNSFSKQHPDQKRLNDQLIARSEELHRKFRLPRTTPIHLRILPYSPQEEEIAKSRYEALKDLSSDEQDFYILQKMIRYSYLDARFHSIQFHLLASGLAVLIFGTVLLSQKEPWPWIINCHLTILLITLHIKSETEIPLDLNKETAADIRAVDLLNNPTAAISGIRALCHQYNATQPEIANSRIAKLKKYFKISNFSQIILSEFDTR